MQIKNYKSSTSMWMWSGVKTLNQLWSYMKVDEPIYVDSIEVYWGGYRGKTKGRHFIAKWTAGNGGKLGDIVARTESINVPQGRGWRKAKLSKPVLLQPGSYAVGVWGDHLEDRTLGIWDGDGGGAIYCKYTTTVEKTTGTKWSPGHGKGNGVVPVRLNGEPAGGISVRVGGSWRKKATWVKVGGTWRQAKSVWVRVGGTWRRNK